MDEKEFLIPIRYSCYKLLSVKASDLDTAIQNTLATFIPGDDDFEPKSLHIEESEARFLNSEF